MTPAQLRRMQAGRRRWLAQQDREARARVRAFKRWLAAGSPLRSIPEIPTDADYRRVQEAA